MSDLSAAAAALGLPEALVQRSAEARASETGASVDDVLAQWAGGEAVAPAAGGAASADTATTEEADEVAEAPETTEEPEESAPAPEVVIEVPGETEPAPAPAPAGPYKPPVLVGTKDSPMTVLAGAVGLFLIVALVGLIGPSIPTDSPGARTSEIGFSEAAAHGREVYATTGCAACHTQMVRPVVADVGLGPVTLDDTNQILGTRRFGPDLSDVGSRVTGSQIEAIIGGLGSHPPLTLDPDDLSDLVAYLAESATSDGGTAES